MLFPISGTQPPLVTKAKANIADGGDAVHTTVIPIHIEYLDREGFFPP